MMDVVERTAVPILEIGRAWMSAPATGQRAVDLGFAPGFGLWVNGRAGAMGEVEPMVAAAAIGFMAPGRVAELWAARPAGLSAAGCATHYAEAAASWGREALASVDAGRLQRTTELARRIAGAADPSTGALFAGWRAVPLPDEPAGAATLALQVLRELRGGAHLSAVHAVGLGPHGAIMSVADPVRGGEAGADRFGWPAPHPAGDPARRAEAESLTSRACEPAYAVLGEAEAAEFTELVLEIRSAIDL